MSWTKSRFGCSFGPAFRTNWCLSIYEDGEENCGLYVDGQNVTGLYSLASLLLTW